MNDVVKNVDSAFLYIFSVSFMLLAGITVTMIWFLIKYRKSKHPVPADIRDNWILEVFWTVIPLIIVLSMFSVGWSSYRGLRNVPEDALEINTIGVQFAWIFEYPNKKESEYLLMVPQGRAIKLNITSEDVIHSLFIPAFRIKMDAVKGMNNYAWFYADKTGNYTILCAEFCGIGHADMGGILRIVPQEEYDKWINEK